MSAVIRHYHGLIACTVPVFTLQPPWNLQLQQHEQTPCSQQIQISQKQNKTAFSCALFAAVYPRMGELLMPLHLNFINRHYLGLWQHIFNVSPELSKGNFSAQREILAFTISTVDLEVFLSMQGMVNSLWEGFVWLVFFHIFDTVLQTRFMQNEFYSCCNYCKYT